MQTQRASFAAALLLAALTGCQGTGPAGPATGRFAVSADRTAFYERGPAQGFGPDLNLSKGQEVEMLERGFGFSRVKTGTGQVGYVATEDLVVLPPSSEPSEPAGSAESSPRSRRVSDLSDPVIDPAPEAPLPQEDPEPVTDFRF